MIIRVSDIESKEVEKPRGGEGVAIHVPYEAAKQFGGDITGFTFINLPPESSIGYHLHEDDIEIYLLLDGIAEVNDNGQEAILTPGDMMITGRGESHSLANHTDKDLSYLAVMLK